MARRSQWFGDVMGTFRSIRRAASVLVVAATVTVLASSARATEPSGLPAALSATSMTSMSSRSYVLVVSDAPWLSCNDAQAPCAGRGNSIYMETHPKWDFKLGLPEGMEVRGYLWTMQLEDTEVYLRQAIGGPVIRKSFGENGFVEVGAGLAQRYVSSGPACELSELTLGETADRRREPSRVGAALMGSLGSELFANEFVAIDARLRTGFGLGDMGEGIYHGHLVLAVTWR
jgi:hypothetical protein